MPARIKKSTWPSHLRPADFFQLAVSRGDGARVAAYLKANDFRVDAFVVETLQRLVLGFFRNAEPYSIPIRLTHPRWWLKIKYPGKGRPKTPPENVIKKCLRLLRDPSPRAIQQIANMLDPDSNNLIHLGFRLHRAGNPTSPVRSDINKAIIELKTKAESDKGIVRKVAIHKVGISRTTEWRARSKA